MMTQQTSYPFWLRLTHWVNAMAVFIMLFSGWRIYNASPLLSFHFPNDFTLGGWLAGALQWHFAAMWVLVVNGLFYLTMNVMTGRFRSKYTPFNGAELRRNIMDTLRLRLHHADLNRYNMIQKLFYVTILTVLVVIVLSGLVMWKPVQFPFLRALLGDYDTARWIHFACMSMIAIFICVHVVMALLVPKTIKGMIVGRF